MNKTPIVWGSLAVCAVIALAGCASGGQRPPTAGTSARPGPQRVSLDGRLAEWPEGVAVLADADYIYFKLGLEPEATLQASSETLTLLLDADGRPSTGAKFSSPGAAAGLGVDLEIRFSPAPDRPGVEVIAHDGTAATPLTHGQIGLVFAPTYASSWFEVRVSRHPAGIPGLAQVLAGSGPGKTMFTLADSAGEVVGWSDPEVFLKPGASRSAPLADAVIPPKSPGTVRVVTWNVNQSTPMSNPGPFARVLTALNPDIILVQEWDQADAPTLRAWCTALLTGEGEWYARTGDGRGVGIIARHPLDALGPARLMAEEGENPVRWIAGVVRTPLGDVAAASVHLKCCGTKGSAEDRRRAAEARAINGAMKSALASGGARARIVAGDYNLVGSRPPLDLLRAGLGADGSDLELGEPFLLGDSIQATWFDADNAFSPGRLDFAVFGGADAVQSFVFDTRLLTDAALARMGLDRGDTAASDHLPLVVDLKPR